MSGTTKPNSKETERLILRRMTLDDVVPVFRTTGDPEVMRYYSSGPDATLEIARSRVQEVVDHWEKYGYGDWVVIEKSTNAIIGYSGLLFADYLQAMTLGYGFERASWGKGFATEAAKAVIHEAFTVVNLPRLIATVDPRNLASMHVLRKCGFVYAHDTTHNGLPRHVYKLKQP